MRALGAVFGGVIGVAIVLVLSAMVAAGSGVPGSGARADLSGPYYNVTFTETGLPSGTQWGVHVAYQGCPCDGVHKTVTSTTPTIVIEVTNGTYRYTVQRVAGYFVNVSASGTFNTSNNSSLSIPVAFHPLIGFVVEFTEVGLPNGTLWTVGVTGNGHGQERALEDQTESSYGTSLNFTLPNGTYRYAVAKVTGSFFVNQSQRGKFVVAGGSPPPVAVTFTTPALVALTFNETGLPAGTNWSVRVGGWGGVPIHEMESSTSSSIVFSLPNGTYRYTIGEVLGFVVNGAISGSETITTQPVTVNVTFQSLLRGAYYPVAFGENGLPNGTHWAVTVVATHTFGHSRSETQSSTNSTIYFLLQNGTYRYVVHYVRAYTITAGGSGTFSISGTSPGVQVVNFSAVPNYTITFTESGLPNGTNWSVLVRSTNDHSTAYYIHEVETGNSTALTFSVPNGSYCYRVLNIPGFRITAPAAGSFNVTGASPAGISVVFTAKA